jgi:hypothetical protein
MKKHTATFIEEITVKDPETKAPVKVSMFKHDKAGAIFGIDSSFLEQCFEDEENPIVADPFNNEGLVELFLEEY